MGLLAVNTYLVSWEAAKRGLTAIGKSYPDEYTA